MWVVQTMTIARRLMAFSLLARTGAPWRDLPERYGAWETVSGRFYRWRRSGIWHNYGFNFKTDPSISVVALIFQPYM